MSRKVEKCQSVIPEAQDIQLTVIEHRHQKIHTFKKLETENNSNQIISNESVLDYKLNKLEQI